MSRLVAALLATAWMVLLPLSEALLEAQPRAGRPEPPAGQLTWALHVTVTPAWLDPADHTAGITARLGSSDAMVIRTRKRLIDAAKALRDSGKVPPGVDDPGVYAVRSGGVVLPRDADWIDATRALRKAWVEHPELSRAVLGGLPAV